MMNKRECKLKFVIAASVLAAFSLILCNVSCANHLSLLEELTPSAPSAKTYTITVTGTEHGTVSVDKKSAAAGETVTISVTPDTGYGLAALTVTDESGKEIECTDNTFKMPESNVTVKASFEVGTYTITVTGAEHGTVSVDKKSAAAGETVKISVTPDTGYVLAALTVTDESGKEIECTDNTFKMPESNVTVNASFIISFFLSGTSFNKIIINDLQAGTSATKFIHSPTPPDESVTTYKLSNSYSDVDVLAWLDGTTIYFYAKGYTDSNKKIPLAAYSSELFKDCSSLQEIEIEFFDTSNVTEMGYMFYGCSALATLDLSCFDTSKVTSMSSMFYGCSALTTLDLSSFDTSKVTDMYRMFYGCSGLTTLDLSSFDTSKVTGMSGMFGRCSGLTTLDLSSFDTSKVTSMGGVYSGMFYVCSGLTTLDLSSFDTSKVTDMDWMFYGCSGLTTLDLSSFDTQNVTDMNYMFDGCSGLTTLDLSSFDTSKVTGMRGMFSGCSGLTTLDLSSFDTSKVTGMNWMFNDCSSLTTLDLSSFDTSNVTGMFGMFYKCSALTTIKVGDNFVVDNVDDSSFMFWLSNSLKGGAGTSYNSSYTDKTYARIDEGPDSDSPGYFTRGN